MPGAFLFTSQHARPIGMTILNMAGVWAMATWSGLLGTPLASFFFTSLLFLGGLTGVATWAMTRIKNDTGESQIRIIAAGTLILAMLITSGASPDLMAQRWKAMTGALTALVLALVTGLALLRMSHIKTQISAIEQLLFGTALGIGTLGSVFFFIGLFSTHPATFALAAILITGMAWPDIRTLGRTLRAACQTEERLPTHTLFAIILMGMVAVVLLGGAFLPAEDYDVTEYHAQLPRMAVERGFIAVDALNVFSLMPQIMETWTTVSISLLGMQDGVIASRIFHFFISLMIPALAAACAHRVAGKGAAVLTALLIMGLPRVLQVNSLLYTEGGMCLFMLAGFFAWLAGRGAHTHAERLRWCLLGGMSAGMACGAKYTALLLILPWMGCAWSMMPKTEDAPRRHRARQLGTFFLWAAILFAPWWLRNFMATGNPLAPLFNGVLGVTGWDPVLEERFRLAHRPHGAEAFLFFTLWKHIHTLFWSGLEASPGMLFALAFLAVPLKGLKERLEWRVILPGMLWMLATWFLFTHRLERFFLPGMVFGALAGGCAAARLGARALWGCAPVAVIAVGYTAILTFFGGMLTDGGTRMNVAYGIRPPQAILETKEEWHIGQALASLSKTSHILAVGEARGLYLPANVVAPVVFAHHPLMDMLRTCPDAESLTNALCEAGYTHLFINWFEIGRLHSTYHMAYGITPEQQRVLRTFLQTHEDTTAVLMPWATPPVERPLPPLPEGWLRTDFETTQGSPYVEGMPLNRYMWQRPWLPAMLPERGTPFDFMSGHFITLTHDWATVFAPAKETAPLKAHRGPFILIQLPQRPLSI